MRGEYKAKLYLHIFPGLYILQSIFRDELNNKAGKDRIMGNPFAHVELMTSDVDAARSFYSDMGSFGIFRDPTGGVMAIWEEPEKS